MTHRLALAQCTQLKLAFCSSEKETVEHLFYTCHYTNVFWSDVHSWICLNIQGVLSFMKQDIYFMDNLDPEISDVVNLVIGMAKFYIHTCR